MLLRTKERGRVIRKYGSVCLIGIAVGLICFVFGSGIAYISNVIFLLFPYNLILLPIVGYMTINTKNKYSNKLENSMSKVFKATKQQSILSFLIMPYQIVTTWFSHIAGASVGREGVAVQLGATIANQSSSVFTSLDKQLLTRLGMAAGFSGLFGTPIAATIFCFEVTKSKEFKYNDLGLTLVAAYFASITSSLLGLNHFHVKLTFISLTAWQYVFLGLAVIIFAICGNLFAIGLSSAKKLVAKSKVSDKTLILICSLIGGALLLVFSDGRYMSLGTNIINLSFFDPQAIMIFDPLLKGLLTIYFVSIGFQGGEVTPLFAIGASAGVLIASIFSLPLILVAAIGYGFVFASATNAYLAASALIIEVFGLAITPYVVFALLITLLVKKDKYTIYPYL